MEIHQPDNSIVLRATNQQNLVSFTPHPKHPWISWKILGANPAPDKSLTNDVTKNTFQHQSLVHFNGSTCGSWLNEVAGEVSTWLAMLGNTNEATKFKKKHTNLFLSLPCRLPVTPKLR